MGFSENGNSPTCSRTPHHTRNKWKRMEIPSKCDVTALHIVHIFAFVLRAISRIDWFPCVNSTTVANCQNSHYFKWLSISNCHNCIQPCLIDAIGFPFFVSSRTSHNPSCVFGCLNRPQNCVWIFNECCVSLADDSVLSSLRVRRGVRCAFELVMWVASGSGSCVILDLLHYFPYALPLSI